MYYLLESLQHLCLLHVGYYLLADASGGFWGDVSRLESPTIVVGEESCLRFYYFMYGADVETLKVFACLVLVVYPAKSCVFMEAKL